VLKTFSLIWSNLKVGSTVGMNFSHHSPEDAGNAIGAGAGAGAGAAIGAAIGAGAAIGWIVSPAALAALAYFLNWHLADAICDLSTIKLFNFAFSKQSSMLIVPLL
jgi:hypothetical protein